MAAGIDSLASGAFIWTDAAGNPLSVSEKTISGRNYFLNVAIEDGSEYDLDATTPGAVRCPSQAP